MYGMSSDFDKSRTAQQQRHDCSCILQPAVCWNKHNNSGNLCLTGVVNSSSTPKLPCFQKLFKGHMAAQQEAGVIDTSTHLQNSP
jgi:hypothetical protein